MKKLLALSLSIALLGAGCGPAAEPVTSLPAPETESSDTSALSGDCRNDFFPARQGYAIDYKTAFNESGSTYTMRVASVTDESIGLEYQFPENLTLTQNLACDGGLLRVLGYLDLGSVAGGEVDFETKSATGSFLPPSLAVGTEWNADFVIDAKPRGGVMAQAGITSIEQTVKTVNKVLAKESVTVTAGTFEAYKVEQDLTITMNIPGLGAGAMEPIKAKTFAWWVKDIGMVKSASDIEGANTSVEAVAIHR